MSSATWIKTAATRAYPSRRRLWRPFSWASFTARSFRLAGGEANRTLARDAAERSPVGKSPVGSLARGIKAGAAALVVAAWLGMGSASAVPIGTMIADYERVSVDYAIDLQPSAAPGASCFVSTAVAVGRAGRTIRATSLPLLDTCRDSAWAVEGRLRVGRLTPGRYRFCAVVSQALDRDGARVSRHSRCRGFRVV